jgi:hypothetical protein
VTADLVGGDVDEYFLLFPCLSDCDEIAIDLQTVAVIESNSELIFAFYALS